MALFSASAQRYSELKLIEKFGELPFLRVEPLTLGDYERAPEAMRRYGLDLEDSLHFTVAERLRVKEIYSNDKDFEKTPLRPTGFKRLHK